MNYNVIEIEKEIDRIFKLQMNYKWKLRESSAKERIEKLKRLSRCILKYNEDIQKAIYSDFKKPEEEVLLTEIYPITSEIKYIIKNLSRWMKDKKIRPSLRHLGAKCRIRYEPKGVSLIMSPWNFPFQLAMGPLISAVAAGNCVVLKPSELSSATSECIKKIISEVFKEYEVAVLQGDYMVSQILLKKPFDNIFFTGSSMVGKLVMESAAKNLTSVTLELGGKSPVIIDDTADLNNAAKKIVWGKSLNAGQICIAPDYLFIHEDNREEFIKLMIKQIKSYYGNIDKVSKGLKFCRIINQKHYARITELIDDAVNRGAKIDFGGYSEENERFISPTILTDLALDCRILEEEIFGPVLPILTYKNIEDVIGYINSKPKPLALYIFSNNNKNIDYILNRSESGDAVINDVIIHAANIKLPFGGINNSGIGKSHGYHGFMAFTHERSYLKQGKISLMPIVYPPFTKVTKVIVEKLIKYL